MLKMNPKNKAPKGTASLSNKELLDIVKQKSCVIGARIILPCDVKTAGWVRLKCQFGCDGYGQCLVCPPYTPTPQQMREVLDSYCRAILIHFEPQADVKAIVAEIERWTSWPLAPQTSDPVPSSRDTSDLYRKCFGPRRCQHSIMRAQKPLPDTCRESVLSMQPRVGFFWPRGYHTAR
jgi:predicted metal-binding protein